MQIILLSNVLIFASCEDPNSELLLGGIIFLKIMDDTSKTAVI